MTDVLVPRFSPFCVCLPEIPVRCNVFKAVNHRFLNRNIYLLTFPGSVPLVESCQGSCSPIDTGMKVCLRMMAEVERGLVRFAPGRHIAACCPGDYIRSLIIFIRTGLPEGADRNQDDAGINLL